MQYEPTTPQQDGFSMPAEFSPHQGCILIWPERPGSWKNGAAAARKAFRSVIAAIAESETVYVAVNPHSRPSAERMLAGMANVRLLDLDSDDAWARDVAPTFVRRAADGAVRGVNWRFNAWGGEVDGLYAHWEKDDAFAGGLLDTLGFRGYDAAPFVMEGGAVHSDGEGTLLVTEACLLSAGRNPQLTKDEIAAALCRMLGAKKVLWLPRGIDGDETSTTSAPLCGRVRSCSRGRTIPQTRSMPARRPACVIWRARRTRRAAASACISCPSPACRSLSRRRTSRAIRLKTARTSARPANGWPHPM